MDLIKTHREALVEKLNRTIEEIELRKSVIDKVTKDGDLNLAAFMEVDLFLLEKRKELIEESLVNNSIDW